MNATVGRPNARAPAGRWPRRVRARRRRRHPALKGASSSSASRPRPPRRLVERQRAPARAARDRAPPAARRAPAAPLRGPARIGPRRSSSRATRSISASESGAKRALCARVVSRSSTRSRCAGNDGSAPTADCRLLSTVARRLVDARATTRRPTPFVEHVQDVGFAEVDAHGRRRGPCGSSVRSSDRSRANATLSGTPSRRPAGHQIERRPDHADQVPVVLPAEIGLDLAAVFRNLPRL